MNDDLDQKSDAELNELFAREVCAWHEGSASRGEYPQYWHNDSGDVMVLASSNLRFCQDANAVLPRLEKVACVAILRGADSWWNVTITASLAEHNRGRCDIYGLAPAFARAAVIALLRAKRATK